MSASPLAPVLMGESLTKTVRSGLGKICKPNYPLKWLYGTSIGVWYIRFSYHGKELETAIVLRVQGLPVAPITYSVLGS